MATRIRISSHRSTRFRLAITLLVLAALAGGAVLWLILTNSKSAYGQIIAGILFTGSLLALLALALDPDTLAARRSGDVLVLANSTLEYLRDGLTQQSAQDICELLLPTTPAIAIAITDRSMVLGYAGYGMPTSSQGGPIRTSAIHEVLGDGKPRILRSNEQIGVPLTSARIEAAIIQPLYQGRTITGTLMFCYRRASNISQEQEAIASGLSVILSTQISAAALEEQTKLATSMELKMLQAQINPHFLFNTINTIASFIRTDPNKARELLREFAVFYRSTLEDANDLIPFRNEMEQVKRYFGFEEARFGSDRLCLEVEISPEMEEMLVPSFMIQPLVENSVRHAMRSEGKLTITIRARMINDDVIIQVTDNGAGMSKEKLHTMMEPESSQGLGIAVKNVHDRMQGYFGPGSRMDVESRLDQGTTVTFTLKRDSMGEFVQTQGAQALELS